MKPTPLIIAALLALSLAMVPTSSAASLKTYEIAGIPCGNDGGSTLDDVLDATYQVACIGRSLAQSEIGRATQDVNTVLDAIDPAVQAAYEICDNRLGNRCNSVQSVWFSTEIDPNVKLLRTDILHDWHSITLQLPQTHLSA